jgi:hypothetical protein
VEWFAGQVASYQEEALPNAIRAFAACQTRYEGFRDDSTAGRSRGPGQPRPAEHRDKPNHSKGWKS